MAVRFNYQHSFETTQADLAKTIGDSLNDYIGGLRQKLYTLLVKGRLSDREYNDILAEMQKKITIHTQNVKSAVKDIYIDVLNSTRLGQKNKQAILNYELAKVLNDITTDFYSEYNHTKTALDHINYCMQMQSARDFNILTKSLKNFTPDQLTDNMQAFKDVFRSDYGQRYMRQLTDNPLLNQLIEQEDDKLYITLNGRRYDLEKYINGKADYYTTNTISQISRASSAENGTEIFRFIRLKPVKAEREHSIHDNEHNDDLFTTNAELVGTEYDGKILLDAYTAISDYHYGDEPPYGCQHIFVGAESVRSEKSVIGQTTDLSSLQTMKLPH